MSNTYQRTAHDDPDHVPGKTAVEVDREIQFRQLVKLGLVLAVITALSGVFVFFLLKGFLRAEQEAAPPPPVMAPEPVLAPGPKLLARPEGDLARVRAAEEERLQGYGWVDPAAGVGRIPIDRALEILAERGLPVRQAPAAGDAGALPGATPAPPPDAGAEPVPPDEGQGQTDPEQDETAPDDPGQSRPGEPQ
jgi:hypothetical protein